MTEPGIYDPRDPIEVGPLTVAEDEASLSTGTYFTAKVSRSLALVVGAVVAVALVGAVMAGRLSAPVHPASTPGPMATVTATVTERTGSTSVTTITATAIHSHAAVPMTVTATSIATRIAATATATDRILVPGPVRTVIQRQPALVVRITTTRTVIRTVRR